MSLSVKLMKQTCEEMGILYQGVGDNEAILKLQFGATSHIILNAALGLNSDAHLKLTHDKYYCYQLLSMSTPMPFTRSYIDPNTFGHFVPYITFTSEKDIVADILQNFSFPVIVKRNSGTQGKNVFLCRTQQEIESAVSTIYSKQQLEYDHVLLAQTYVHPKKEYRVIVFNKQVELVYHKDNSSATYCGNLSPLHWQGAVSRVETDINLIERIQVLVNDLVGVFPIVYTGLDVIEDEQGKLWLIEMNDTPQFGEFVKHNDEQLIIGLYKKILKYLQNKYLFHYSSRSEFPTLGSPRSPAASAPEIDVRPRS